jgi:hypothetical protein
MNEYEEIDQKILMKYLEQAYYEHIENKYKNLGYETFRNSKIEGSIETDFLAKKNEKIVVYEIKIGKYNKNKKQSIVNLKKYIDLDKKNRKLKMVFLNPPQYKDIIFEELDQIILDDMMENLPDELDVLSTHTRMEEISDIEIDSIEITKDSIHVCGNARVGVSMQYGSDSDGEGDGSNEFSDSYPFKFDLYLSKDFSLDEAEYDIDNSSFYE